METRTVSDEDVMAAQAAIDDVASRANNAPAPDKLAPSSPRLGADSW